MLNAFRHQRKKHSAARDAWGRNGRQCSTPFGINGRNTGRQPHAEHAGQVLNAFRHQRKKHAWPLIGPVFRSSVLPVSAQRLSASTEETHQTRSRPACQERVLNAFRHQRKIHLYRRRLHTKGIVLNAFRHQRKKHHSDQAQLRITPRNGAQRLSASTEETQPLRYEPEFGTINLLESSAQRLSASTEPKTQRRILSVDQREQGAQRLSASTEETLVNHILTEHTVKNVLNAFRHQRKKHASADNSTQFAPASAQRLSASTEETPQHVR